MKKIKKIIATTSALNDVFLEVADDIKQGYTVTRINVIDGDGIQGFEIFVERRH